jgi:sensor histidine kinase regulating citrate/malate metabolism
MPNSEFKISFKSVESFINIEFNMISLKVEPDELDKIFSEEISGHWSEELELAGDGIGMFMIKKLIELNKGTVNFIGNFDKSKGMKYNNIPYENNKIIINLRK